MAESCGSKHAKWGIGIIVTVLIACVTLSLGVAEKATNNVPLIEQRVRQIEQQQAAIAERLKGLDERTIEIRDDVKTLKARP